MQLCTASSLEPFCTQQPQTQEPAEEPGAGVPPHQGEPSAKEPRSRRAVLGAELLCFAVTTILMVQPFAPIPSGLPVTETLSMCYQYKKCFVSPSYSSRGECWSCRVSQGSFLEARILRNQLGVSEKQNRSPFPTHWKYPFFLFFSSYFSMSPLGKCYH